MVLQSIKEEYDGRNGEQWCFAISRILPSLADLHQAIRLRELRKVRLLCAYTAVNADSSLRSVTALSLAVQIGDPEIVAILLAYGADANKLSAGDRATGRLEPPLFTCCRRRGANHDEIARMLLEHGADVNAVDFHMHAPLWIATRERSVDVVELLITYGANLNAGDKRNPCPLYLATKYGLGRSEIAVSLIRHGCKLDIRDAECRGAVYWSLVNNLSDVLKLLIRAGARISGKDREYMTDNRRMPVALRQNDQLYNWIRYELDNPPTLSRLAKNAIRSQLAKTSAGQSIWPGIGKLPIPECLKQDMMMMVVEEDSP